MKLNFLNRIALFAAGIGLVVFGLYACRKNQVKPQPEVVNDITLTPDYDAKVKSFVSRVKHFEETLEKCKTMRVAGNMQIDSVLWNMEALFNTSYSSPEKDYVETVKQDLTFYVNLDEDGSLPLNDVSNLYEDVTNSVRDAYANDGITEDKSLMTVVFEKGEVVGDRSSVDVHVISGRSNDNNGHVIVEDGPFKPGDCWYFGEYGGSCDDPSIVYDAAEIIEDSINYYFAGTPVPVSGCRYINYNLITKSLEGPEYLRPNGESYIYNSSYTSNPSLYFNYERLNYYFNGEKKVILQLLPNDLKNTGELLDNVCFIQVDIRGILESGNAFHHNSITYGDRILVPVNEIGPARNLLN
ncbi:MAG: hypothetical protein MJZ78_00855 [Bacteroidales bacterium]|nr:hypothetical protein [Bacteroidales bacterium]